MAIRELLKYPCMGLLCVRGFLLQLFELLGGLGQIDVGSSSLQFELVILSYQAGIGRSTNPKHDYCR